MSDNIDRRPRYQQGIHFFNDDSATVRINAGPYVQHPFHEDKQGDDSTSSLLSDFDLKKTIIGILISPSNMLLRTP